ncbi:hypothetical protein FHR27_003120 [Pseudomonas flavescens]|uniref:Uncharacterized protein n=2 Tax=Pseudomonadales TaxID=72274 RepID=A0A7Z0BPZ6_9GAMM|nr:hypothetical protein [Pseudomonas flavescens]
MTEPISNEVDANGQVALLSSAANDLRSIERFAATCGVTTDQVGEMIENGSLPSVTRTDVLMVDLSKLRATGLDGEEGDTGEARSTTGEQLVQDAQAALAYLGQTVLVELMWDDQLEPLWQCVQVVGVVLPVVGVWAHGYFMVMGVAGASPFPDEVFFSDIRTLRVVRLDGRAEERAQVPGSAEHGADETL